MMLSGYYNFPVSLLRGFLEEKNRNSVLSNILYYATYRRALELAYGEEPDYDECQTAMNELNWLIDGSTEPDYDDLMERMNRGKKLHEENQGWPNTGIARTMYWDYHDNKKNEWQAAQLLGFLALKSIVGQRKAVKVTNQHWISRMSGLKKYNEYGLDPLVLDFMTEHRSRKLKGLLQEHWGMKHYAQHTRGFWVSFKRNISGIDLAEIAERAKAKNKINKRKYLEKQARIEALKRIRENPDPSTRPDER